VGPTTSSTPLLLFMLPAHGAEGHRRVAPLARVIAEWRHRRERSLPRATAAEGARAGGGAKWWEAARVIVCLVDSGKMSTRQHARMAREIPSREEKESLLGHDFTAL